MILSFDPAKEAGRYDRYADARKRAVAVREDRKKNLTTVAIVENPVTAKLIEIQKKVEAKDYANAEGELKKLLSENPAEARVYYNLGRVSSLVAQGIEDQDAQKAKLLEAKVAFENVIRLAQKQKVDAALQSLSYVSLAKIYEFFDDKTYAIGIYDAAIKLGDVTGGAFKEAIASKQRLMKEQ